MSYWISFYIISSHTDHKISFLKVSSNCLSSAWPVPLSFVLESSESLRPKAVCISHSAYKFISSTNAFVVTRFLWQWLFLPPSFNSCTNLLLSSEVSLLFPSSLILLPICLWPPFIFLGLVSCFFFFYSSQQRFTLGYQWSSFKTLSLLFLISYTWFPTLYQGSCLLQI